MPSCPFCKKHELTGVDLQNHISYKHPEEATDIAGPIRVQPRKFKRKPKGKSIVVDGNNVAYYDGEAKVINIKKMRTYLKKEGYDPIIVVSAALRHDIDDIMELTRIINLGWVIEVETGEDDDEIAIEEANRKKCKIISNDNFKEYREIYRGKEWSLKDAIMNYEIEDGKIKLK